MKNNNTAVCQHLFRRFPRLPGGISILLLLVLSSACSTPAPPASVFAAHPTPDNLVLQWNELALSAVRNEIVIRPTTATRQLFLLHAAMYDAWSAFHPQAKPYALDPAVKVAAGQNTAAAQQAAISQAAYQVLRHEFPRFERDRKGFSRQLIRLGLRIRSSGDSESPAGIGYLAARAVMEKRATDGSNPTGTYTEITSDYYPQRYAAINPDDPRISGVPGKDGFDPNRWQPLRVPYPRNPRVAGRYVINHDDRTTYDIQRFMTPQWGTVTPFALTSGSELRPPPPPHLGSDAPYTDATGKQTTNDQAYRDQVAELMQINAGLTEDFKVIAEFWADGPRSDSPPGHWNQLAHGISERDHHTVDDDIKMYFALNAAVLDAGIAAWECKRYYDYVRPVTAIHYLYYDQTIRGWGGQNRGTETMLGQDWQPYQQQSFVTPGFPEYVSGHSSFSAAAATVLQLFSGSDSFYDGHTRTSQDIDGDGEADLLGQFIFKPGRSFFEDVPHEDVVLRWPTLQDAANQAAMSRRYGGIHFQDGDLRGRELGRAAGRRAFDRARSYWQ
jgi:hypothetical protein